MVSRAEYICERKRAAHALEESNRKACIHFAEVLRSHDEYERICKQLGMPAEEIIPKRYFEIVYRVLCFGTVENRAALLLGAPEAIDKLVRSTDQNGGFYDEKGFWIEV